ncbi:MAG: fibronectin type III domain-containing protein, partial [Gemmatimonadota bacterium]|nr:fibronectin type III domain-containing protein [Gemmatimonadota bacterium]
MNRILAVSICIAALVGCGGDGAAPTTAPPPAPTPTPPAPPPPPPPVPPAAPSGLRVAASGADFIEWTWNAVEGADGYDAQFSSTEAFTDEDEIIARTAEQISYRRDGLEAGTTAYLRVRSASGTGEERITSDWSAHVPGMTEAPTPPPEPPATPTGLEVSDSGSDFIEWSWEPVAGALGYVVQTSTDDMFDDAILGNAETVLFDGLPFTTETSYTAADLEADTTLHVRVATAGGTPTAPLVSAFTTHVTGMTLAPAPPPPEAPATPTDFRVSAETADSITWTWNAVAGAQGYLVQISTDEVFEDMFEGDDEYAVRVGTANTSFTATDLPPGTTLHVRVAAGVLKAATPSLDPEDYLL